MPGRRVVVVGVVLATVVVGAAATYARNQPEYVISGRVQDPHDLKPQDAILMLGSNRGGGSASSRPVPASADGSFTTPPVRPGTYVLEVVRTPHSRTAPATTVGLTVVSVTAADVTDVAVIVRRDSALIGRYRMESDNPAARWPSHIHVTARLVAGDGRYLGSTGSEGAPDGRFVLRNAFGPRVLRTGYTLEPNHRWWPTRVLLDGKDITNVPTDFSRHEGSRLEFFFTQHPSRILGRVLHQDGRPAARAWVFIAAEDEKLHHEWATTSHVVQAGADGIFSIVTLPGRYVARAFPPNRLISSRGATHRIAEIGSGGTPIVLGEREQKSVQLIVEANGATRH